MVPNPVTYIPPELPRTQTAIVQYEGGILKTTEGVKLPHIPPDRMMVRVIAVALNPCDYKMPYRFPSPGAGNGTDFAGVVVAIGPNVAKVPSFEIGDAVFGAVYGANPIDPESGSFAQYIRADPEFTLHKPESMSWQMAASIGASGIATLGLALSRSLGLPGTPSEPAKQPEQVLVYGGSTSVGTMAIQLLRFWGHTPITTCSPQNFDLVKSYGAEAVWDYKSPSCARDIKAYTNNTLQYVLDPLTEAKTQKLCYECISRAGGKYVALEMWQPKNHTRPTVEIEFVIGSAIIGDRIALDQGYGSDADPEKRQFGIKYYRDIQKLIDNGKLRAHPSRVIPGAWQGVLEGIEMLKSRTISAQKLVCGEGCWRGTPIVTQTTQAKAIPSFHQLLCMQKTKGYGVEHTSLKPNTFSASVRRLLRGRAPNNPVSHQITVIFKYKIRTCAESPKHWPELLAGAMSSVLYTGVVAVASIAGLAACAGKFRSDKSLSLIPVLKFDDDDTQERYVTSTREIIHDGYERVRESLHVQS
ncbi:MAG: hypothetical protein Q9187_003339 [Circinaria calcarea]